MDKPPLIDVEIEPPIRLPHPLPGSDAGAVPPSPAVREMYHPAASALLVLVDNLWMIPEFGVFTLWFTIPLCFLSVFVITLVIQRSWGRNGWLLAFAKALFFGVVAAVPFSVTGTPVGLALLAWAGVHRWKR